MLVEEVSGESEVKSKALQTSFDLLGETLKFNPQLFQVFNSMVRLCINVADCAHLADWLWLACR